jgi:hypothetical protein
VKILLELFVDDGTLAAAIVAVVALSAIVAHFVPGITAGIVLLAGTLLALFGSI